MSSPVSVAESYEYCSKIARTRAKNFYYSFVLLSSEQKNAMCAIYAFMRYCDDLSDAPGATAAPIERWREDLTQALAGKPTLQSPLWPGFQDAVRRYNIPRQYFYEMIDGVLSDLQPRRIRTFDELYRYCYQVASVVGLTIIHIFGFDSPGALPLAEKCGIAFQLTNILRDIREDAERDRIYLPEEDLERFGVTADDLRQGRKTEAFARMMDFQAARARRYYDESRPLLGLVHKGSRSSLWALITIYSNLLDRIRKSNYDVLSRRIRLSTFEKSCIVLRAMCGGI
jgi:15-cis-phytoene synthase